MADPMVRAAAVATRGNDVLVVQSGGEWSVPSVAVDVGETLAEAVARAVRTQTDLDALASPFMGWYEELPAARDAGPHDDEHTTGTHLIVMCFGAVVMDDRTPKAGPDVVEARWMAVWDFSELPLADGLAELLAEHGIIDTLT